MKPSPKNQQRIICLSYLGALILLGNAAYAQDVTQAQTCLECHKEKDLTHEVNGKQISLFIDGEPYKKSVHGELSCVDCHEDIKEVPHGETLAKVDCSKCHEEVQTGLKGSVHEIKNGPRCLDCHGDPHKMLPKSDRGSFVNHFRVAATCGQCHSDVAPLRDFTVPPSKKEMLYKESVHATELANGNEKAPTCTQCHGAHDILPLSNQKSRTNFLNVPKTCGQCHTSERDQYLESVHGKSAESGHKDAPVCTDCHGEHAIFRVSDQRSPVSFFNVAGNTCGRCHASIVINEKYGIPSGRVDNYFNSYHGLALQHGSPRVANCASCHGQHLILPSADPRSTVSPQRLVETCGKCHSGITANVLSGPIHSEVTLRSKTIVAWVPRIYIPLIVIIVGGMVLHNLVILWAMLKKKFAGDKQQPQYQRFTRFEIIAHIILTVAFIALVVTGFTLKNPNSWWVTLLSYLYLTEEIRGIIHRTAGVALIAVSIVFSVYMVVTRRGRSETLAFLPRPRDLRHVIDQLAYYMGKRPTPPEFDRYDYTEKMEFWALVWGVIIMAVTGLILWFPIQAFHYLPKWAIDIAELIHYYEAVLATLAIAIWHFFFVIFHPEEYPMSTTWLTGKMPYRHLKHRHPLEYERLDIDKSEEETKE